ncbi:MAG: hypothetical protein IPG64_20115 [Haliea sp.]|nr:hypothetical protein [Haliea sp.]
MRQRRAQPGNARQELSLQRKKLTASYDRGEFGEAELDDNCANSFATRWPPQGIWIHRRTAARLQYRAHQQLAPEMAEASITLPEKATAGCCRSALETVRKIAVIDFKLKKRNCLPLWGDVPVSGRPTRLRLALDCGRRMATASSLSPSRRNADVAVLFVGLSHRPGLDSR